MEDSFSPSIVSAVRLAKSFAAKDNHPTYGVSHLVLAMMYEPTGLSDVLKSIDKDVAYVQEWFEVRSEMYQPDETVEGEGIMPDREVTLVIEESERSKIKLGTDYIDAICIFSAIVRDGVIYNSKQLETITVSEEDFLNLYHAPLQLNKLGEDASDETLREIGYCENLLTQQRIDQGSMVVGRDNVIRNIIENLDRQENRGILVIGDSGVGKSAIIKALLHYIANSPNKAYSELNILGLNTSKLLASSTNSSEVVKKLSDVFDKIAKINQSILVIDDLQIITEGRQDSINIINLIASELKNGRTHIIATITGDAYRKTIEKHSINRNLEVILLEELEASLLMQCMENHRTQLVAHYQIKIDKSAIEEAIHSSKRYFKENKLPYGAINLLDKTMATVKMSNINAGRELELLSKELKNIKLKDEHATLKLKYLHKQVSDKVGPILLSKANNFDSTKVSEAKELQKEIKKLISELQKLVASPVTELTSLEVTAVVSYITGIPIGKIQAEEKDRLLNIEKRLELRVKGQNHAISTLSDAIIESRSGLSNPNQPIGSFFFLGPTGTGKTELTKSLAELLFDDDTAMIRFDMSEFKEEHSAALLYGAPPGYVGYEEGGMLVNKIRQKPYSVVLFDEIEKAHSSVYDVFLQIMDEGKIHDKLGREGDFSNAIIIFTSNIGSEWIAEQIEQGNTPTSNQLIEVMSRNFRPEFLGRLTEVVPFAPINEEVAELIFKLHLGNLQKQLLEQKEIELTLTPEAISYLSKKGFSKKYGARPIAGIIRTYIKKVISRMIVAQNIVGGDRILLDYKESSLTWEKL